MNESLINSVDWIGYLGSACVLTAFCMKQIQTLRLVSIGGNCVFIAYACLAGLMPVLLMNVMLLGLNLYRFIQARRAAPKPAPAAAGPVRFEAPVRVRCALAPLV
jgi:hypothetical protein